MYKPILILTDNNYSGLDIDPQNDNKLSIESKEYCCKNPQQIILIDTEAKIVEGDLVYCEHTDAILEFKNKTACILANKQEEIHVDKTYHKVISSTNKSHNLPQLSPKSIQIIINYYNEYKCMPESVDVEIHEHINFKLNDKVVVIKDCYKFPKGSNITIIGFNHNNNSNLVSFEEDNEFNQGFHISNLEHEIIESIENNKGEVDINIPEIEEKLYTKKDMFNCWLYSKGLILREETYQIKQERNIFNNWIK